LKKELGNPLFFLFFWAAGRRWALVRGSRYVPDLSAAGLKPPHATPLTKKEGKRLAKGWLKINLKKENARCIAAKKKRKH
jgi:hypothetical protein